MSWSVEKQRRYMKIIVDDDKEARRIMNSHFPEEVHSISLIAALAEAYRAGAIDSIFKDE